MYDEREVEECRRRSRLAREETARKRGMIPYMAEIHLEVRAGSERDARLVLHRSGLFALVAQDALHAGDVLHPAEKQQRDFSQFARPAEGRSDRYHVEAHLRFVSESPTWEVASAWLPTALASFRSEDVTVLEVRRYTGLWD